MTQNLYISTQQKPVSYHIWTIGCQMNKADSERLESALSQMGLLNTSSPNEADVIVLNSCVVRQTSEDKVVGYLTSLKPLKEHSKNKIVALMGCMVGPNQAALKKRFKHVDVFMQPQQFDPLINLLGDILGIDPEGCIGPLVAKPDVTTYIPITHGCDKFCSFCIIPYRRGRQVSRSIEDMVRETTLLAKRGVKEITLLGQNVDSYGHDLSENIDLGDLLSAINDVSEIKRVRFLTSHPNDMSDHIIESISELEKVCEHINLPFQAGDDTILDQMRRGYSNDEYRRLVDKIRKKIPNVSLSTDLIVGFCGETNEQFKHTVDMVRDIRFDKIHAAMYSTRPGTIASRTMEDNVSKEEKNERLKIIQELQEQILTEINSDLLGETIEILVEGHKRGKWFGRSRNDKLVYFEDAQEHKGSILNIEITKTGPWSLHGVLKHGIQSNKELIEVRSHG